MIKSLIINPGSTSTKLGIFEDETLISEETLRHTTEEIAQFEKIVDQVDFRKEMILNFLADKGEDIKSFNVNARKQCNRNDGTFKNSKFERDYKKSRYSNCGNR